MKIQMNTRQYLLAGITLLLLLILLLRGVGFVGHSRTPSDVKIRITESVLTPSPPTNAGIPHIIHQTWDSHMVSGIFGNWIKSWTGNHSEWEYWFWTPEDGRLLLKMYFPDVLPFYDGLNNRLFQIDVMRYFVMYKFGGMFVDLDTISLKPMDPWTKNHSCVLSENNYVHSKLLKGLNRSEATLGVVLGRPGHPFFTLALNMLSKYWDLFYGEKRLFVDKVYRDYIKSNISKQFGNDITLTHPMYFLPTYDPKWTQKVDLICRQKGITKDQQEMCKELQSRNMRNRPLKKSYINHLWGNLIMKSEEWKKQNVVSIFEIVPHAKNVSEMLLGMSEQA